MTITPADRPVRRSWILPAIVVGQLLATSIWFAVNAVIGALQPLWGIEGGEGIVTTAVQLGFISGTLAFAVLGLADRFHPSRLFLLSASIAAAANVGVIPVAEHFGAVLVLRFLSGFFLAGVYPVGMKIAAGWYRAGLGRALGFLVGALVLGTASPHLLKAAGADWDWQAVMIGTSLAALIGGLVVALVPEGPHLARGGTVRFRGVLSAFRRPAFRASALGYFGHMWELYAFWAFLPVWMIAYGFEGPWMSATTFAVIAIGALGCAGGGFFARRFGSGRVALVQLFVSGACCLLSPLLFHAPPMLLLPFVLIWGVTVAGDSPQFSALNARNAPEGVVGSALTLVNSAGFAVTILSLGLLEYLQHQLAPAWLLLPLVLGPVIGLAIGRPLWRDAGPR